MLPLLTFSSDQLCKQMSLSRRVNAPVRKLFRLIIVYLFVHSACVIYKLDSESFRTVLHVPAQGASIMNTKTS